MAIYRLVSYLLSAPPVDQPVVHKETTGFPVVAALELALASGSYEESTSGIESRLVDECHCLGCAKGVAFRDSLILSINMLA